MVVAAHHLIVSFNLIQFYVFKKPRQHIVAFIMSLATSYSDSMGIEYEALLIIFLIPYYVFFLIMTFWCCRHITANYSRLFICDSLNRSTVLNSFSHPSYTVRHIGIFYYNVFPAISVMFL